MKKPLIETSWDDGHPLDFKIAELLEQYKMPGVFYVSLKKRKRDVMSKSQIYELSKRFEIGAHTLNHVHLTRISPKEAKEEIEGSKKAIEDIIGKKVTKFCYPYGDFNKEIGMMVKKAGFESARTVNWFRTDREFDSFFQPTTIHFYPHPVLENIGHCIKRRNWEGLKYYLKIGVPVTPLRLSESFFKKSLKDGYFHLWGHSWEIEKNGLWKELEEAFKLLNLGEGENIWEDEEIEYWDKKIYSLNEQSVIERNHPEGNRNFPLEKNLFCKIRPFIKGKTLLEIGCGDARYVANLLNPEVLDYKYIGLDLSPAGLRTAKKYINSKRASFVCSSMENIPLGKESLDIILALGAVHHASSQEKLIRKLAPLVKKGGFLLLNEPLKRPGILGLLFQKVLKPIVHEIEHEARLDENKLLSEINKKFKIVLLKKEVSPIRTFLILFLSRKMERSLTLTRIVASIDSFCIQTLGKVISAFSGGELYLVARKK